jgi:molybdopterin-guanine dinucleotide biosynthesis protein B
MLRPIDKGAFINDPLGMTDRSTIIGRKRLIGLAGWSGSGKTTLLAKLIPVLAGRGLTVSTIKHAHHHFDIDQPGKDSWIHRQAGATEVLVASRNRFALIHEYRGAPEPGLDELVAKLSPADIVIVEGFRGEPHPKIEIFRPELGKPFLYPNDAMVLAVASPEPIRGLTAPWLPLDDPETIADFILASPSIEVA